MIIHTPSIPKPKIYEDVVTSTEEIYEILEKDFNEKADVDQYKFSMMNGAIYVTGNVNCSINDILPDVDMINIEYYVYICFDNQDYINLLKIERILRNDFDYEKKHLKIIGFQLNGELMANFKWNLYSALDNLKEYHNNEKIYNKCLEFCKSNDETERAVGELYQYKFSKGIKNAAQQFYMELTKENTENDFNESINNFSLHKKLKKISDSIKNKEYPKFSEYWNKLGEDNIEGVFIPSFFILLHFKTPLCFAYEKYIFDRKHNLISEKVKQLNEFEKMKVWYNNLSYGLESFYSEYQPNNNEDKK